MLNTVLFTEEFAVDGILLGILVVGVVLMAGAYVFTRRRGFGSAMATFASSVVFTVMLLVSIAYRLMTFGPGA